MPFFVGLLFYVLFVSCVLSGAVAGYNAIFSEPPVQEAAKTPPPKVVAKTLNTVKAKNQSALPVKARSAARQEISVSSKARITRDDDAHASSRPLIPHLDHHHSY